MGGFSADWLQLREPADHAARSRTLTEKLAAMVSRSVASQPATTSPVASQQAHGNDEFRIIDLGTGTGSNLRFLLPHLAHHQHWLLIDNDAALLAQLPDRLRGWADEQGISLDVNNAVMQLEHRDFSARIECLTLDLATRLDQLPLADASLVTAAALLDLTTTHWIDSLVTACRRHKVASLFTLNVDGRHHWMPEHPLDATVAHAFNAHLERDKGFGPAAGSRAGHYVHDRMQAAGFDVCIADSDWKLSAMQTDLMRELTIGIAAAAIEQAPERQPEFRDWLQTRMTVMDSGQAALTVGHVDVLSLPTTLTR